MRPDLQVVAALVPERARVLDLACGQGELLAELARARGCRVQGVERDPEAFHACVARGLPVVHADIDDGLPEIEAEEAERQAGSRSSTTTASTWWSCRRRSRRRGGPFGYSGR